MGGLFAIFKLLMYVGFGLAVVWGIFVVMDLFFGEKEGDEIDP